MPVRDANLKKVGVLGYTSVIEPDAQGQGQGHQCTTFSELLS